MIQANKIFVIALTRHRNFGPLLVPYEAEQIPGEPFLRLCRKVRVHDLNDAVSTFSMVENRMVRIAERYSNEVLVKRFCPDKSSFELQNMLKKEEVRKKVATYIEAALTELLELLKNSPVPVYQKREKYGNLYSEDLVSLCFQDTVTVFNFIRSGGETRYFLTLRSGNDNFSLLGKNIEILVSEPCRIYYQNRIYFFDHLSAGKLLPFREKEYISIAGKMEDRYYETFILNSIKSQEVRVSGFEIRETTPQKEVSLSLERDLNGSPVFVLYFSYNGIRLKLQEGEQRVVKLNKVDGEFIFDVFSRDFEWENEKSTFLLSQGLVGDPDALRLDPDHSFNGEEPVHSYVQWLSDHARSLAGEGIAVVQTGLPEPYYLGTFELRVAIESKIDWFDLEMMVKIGEWSIPFVRFKRHILNRIREFRLPGGEIFILPEVWFNQFSEIFSLGRTEAGRIMLKRSHYMLLSGELASGSKTLQQKIKALVSRKIVQQEIPWNLHALLRNYQHEGYNWLYHLYQNHMNGCLADDMGLGKTLQTLVLLLRLRRHEDQHYFPPSEPGGQLSLFQNSQPSPREYQPASLIVLPVSLLHNWENEIRKFTPSLRVFTYSGVKRREKQDMEQLVRHCDIILTTYGTVRNDAEVLSQFSFYYLILDESQNIKNSESKSYRAILTLKSKYRLALTGTPIENSLSDLWSQMNFLNPGHLGSYKFFRENYLVPIEKDHDPESSARLNKLIEPFILRRTKEQVEADLPPVMEETLTIEMTAAQLELYETEKSQVRNYLMQNIDQLEPRNTTFIVLQALTRLRQIAIHPRLIDPLAETESGKFNEILSMLEILVSENHKILVFSSFVKHLNLLDEACRKMNWGFCRLTGQTTDRKTVIEEFQTGNDRNIFLISLKAGGVGLNLTAADYIFIIDPWWNPASEMQAISRSHRIGQHKKVFVYRFISEKSIEEKIQLLQEKKAALANEFINRNDPFTVFGREELIQLFE